MGRELEAEYARKLAAGDIDPLSKLPMKDINPGAFSPSKVHMPLSPAFS